MMSKFIQLLNGKKITAYDNLMNVRIYITFVYLKEGKHKHCRKPVSRGYK